MEIRAPTIADRSTELWMGHTPNNLHRTYPGDDTLNIKNHPNLHAVQLTVDVIQAVHNAARGTLASDTRQIIDDKLRDEVTRFVVAVSENLDQRFGQ